MHIATREQKTTFLDKALSSSSSFHGCCSSSLLITHTQVEVKIELCTFYSCTGCERDHTEIRDAFFLCASVHSAHADDEGTRKDEEEAEGETFSRQLEETSCLVCLMRTREFTLTRGRQERRVSFLTRTCVMTCHNCLRCI